MGKSCWERNLDRFADGLSHTTKESWRPAMHEVTCFKHCVCSALLSLGDSSDTHSGLWSKRLEEGFSGPGSRLGVLKVLIGSVNTSQYRNSV